MLTCDSTLLPATDITILVAWTQTRNKKNRELAGRANGSSHRDIFVELLPCKAKRNSFTILSLISMSKIGVLHPWNITSRNMSWNFGRGKSVKQPCSTRTFHWLGPFFSYSHVSKAIKDHCRHNHKSHLAWRRELSSGIPVWRAKNWVYRHWHFAGFLVINNSI